MKKRLNVPRSARSGPQRYSNGGIPWQILLSLILVLQCACSGDEESAPGGSRQQVPPLDSPEQRIVSLSALATHFVTELGVGHMLVGVDAESSTLPGLADLPVVDLESAHNLAPDIVLIPDLVAVGDVAARSLELAGARLVEFAPHDFEDVFALCRAGTGARRCGDRLRTARTRRWPQFSDRLDRDRRRHQRDPRRRGVANRDDARAMGRVLSGPGAGLDDCRVESRGERSGS